MNDEQNLSLVLRMYRDKKISEKEAIDLILGLTKTQQLPKYIQESKSGEEYKADNIKK